jgi:hypothetical protein
MVIIVYVEPLVRTQILTVDITSRGAFDYGQTMAKIWLSRAGECHLSITLAEDSIPTFST